jgi:hypothetical protein
LSRAGDGTESTWKPPEKFSQINVTFKKDQEMLQLQDRASVILNAIQSGTMDALKHVMTVPERKGLRPTKEILLDGEADREALSTIFWKLAIALSNDREEGFSLGPVADPFEHWEGDSDAYFEARLPNLPRLHFDLCVNHGKVFIKIEH